VRGVLRRGMCVRDIGSEGRADDELVGERCVQAEYVLACPPRAVSRDRVCVLTCVIHSSGISCGLFALAAAWGAGGWDTGFVRIAEGCI
jgi:hypothetical protein